MTIKYKPKTYHVHPNSEAALITPSCSSSVYLGSSINRWNNLYLNQDRFCNWHERDILIIRLRKKHKGKYRFCAKGKIKIKTCYHNLSVEKIGDTAKITKKDSEDYFVETKKIFCKTERGIKITVENDLKRRLKLKNVEIKKNNAMDFIIQD